MIFYQIPFISTSLPVGLSYVYTNLIITPHDNYFLYIKTMRAFVFKINNSISGALWELCYDTQNSTLLLDKTWCHLKKEVLDNSFFSNSHNIEIIVQVLVKQTDTGVYNIFNICSENALAF